MQNEINGLLVTIKYQVIDFKYVDLILLGIELAVDPPPPRRNFVHYDF